MGIDDPILWWEATEPKVVDLFIARRLRKIERANARQLPPDTEFE